MGSRLPAWEVATKPADAIRMGESIYIHLNHDALFRGFDDAFTVIGHPKHMNFDLIRVELMSSAGTHPPIHLFIPSQWFEPDKLPSKVETFLRIFTGCFRDLEKGE